MAWTNDYDTSYPDGAVLPGSILDDSDREIKKAIQERLDGNDIYFPLTGTQVSSTDAGKHRKVTFKGILTTKPTLLTDECALYTKEVSGKWELFFENEDGTEKQLTTLGLLNVAEAEILGLLTNDTYFTAIDEAGTGTVNLIKAGRNEADDTDVAVVPDETRLASNAAPTEDTQVSNKKYVDDMTTMVPAISGVGTGYAGEESVTLPNGLIMKFGKNATPTGNHPGGIQEYTVTFAEAFPNALVSCSALLVDNQNPNSNYSGVINCSNPSTTGVTFAIIEFDSTVQNMDGFYWMAIGY